MGTSFSFVFEFRFRMDPILGARHKHKEVLEKLDRFHAEVLSANWADYLYLVYNGPFWEVEQIYIGPQAHPSGLQSRKT